MGKKVIKTIKGGEAFNNYFCSIFGVRWKGLLEELIAPKKYIQVKNKYFIGEKEELEDESLPSLNPNCFPKEYYGGKIGVFRKPIMDSNGLLDFYPIDGASTFAPMALDIKHGESVLDLCAAPGGKSLILAYSLLPHGELVVNELSKERRGRLKKVLSQYLPPELIGQIKITRRDASKWCLYEKILSIKYY
jgi:16S rRNA C967 or C1407 C5-methylase (RsmB/RsmF family)